MAEIKYKDIVKKKPTDVEILSIRDFIKNYHDGLTPEAVHYAIKNDKVDYTVPYNGRERFIVMTEKTQEYKPINHPSRKSTLEL